MSFLKLVALDTDDLRIISAHVQDAVLKIGDWAEISSMALAAIIGMFLHAVLPGRETAGNTQAVLEK